MTHSEIQEALKEPFPVEDVGWKPQAVKGERCLAVAYVDARNIMDRLDNVLGIGNWQDDYTLLPNHSVVCKLQVCIDGNWIVKCDVGSPSDQPDEGDRLKAAFSDALKRSAVKLGIGRYLYNLPLQWVDFDPVKKQIKNAPRLPEWAIPKPPRTKDTETLRKAAMTILKQGSEDGVSGLEAAWKTLSEDMKKATVKEERDAMRTETLAKTVDLWKKWIESNPTIDNLNKHVEDIRKETPEVWKMVKEYASRHSLVFDERSKQFKIAEAA